MPKNVNSSSGLAEDLVRSIQQMCCSELHLITLYEKTLSELENGLVDIENESVRTSHMEKLDQYRQDLIDVTQIRRKAMVKLFGMSDKGDKDVWCMVKHMGSASYTAWETYLASDDDPELLDIAMESNKVLVKYLTMFLGAEVSSCASCFSDFLKGKSV